MSKELIDRAGEIIGALTPQGAQPGAEPYCVLALLDEQGYPTASTITPAKSIGIEQIYFGTGVSSNKAKRIALSNRAAVCVNGASHNITLVGEIEVLTDAEIKQECWYNGLSGHFSGADDPEYCVLRFTTKRYNLFVDFQPEFAGEL